MIKSKQEIQKIRNLISKNKLDETFDMLKTLNVIDFENVIINLTSQYNDLKRKEIISVISEEDKQKFQAKIIASVLAILTEIEKEIETDKVTIEPQLINIIPFYNCNNLIGRLDLLKKIHLHLFSNNQFVLIHGFGGIGKTTIAKAYINSQYSQNYKHIAWVTIIESFINSFLYDFSQKSNFFEYITTNDEETNFKKLIYTLQKIEGNNLLIIDNANNPVEILKYIENLKSTRWKILFTSRAIPDYIPNIKIESLEPDECKKIFLHFYQKDCELIGVQQLQDLDKLLKHINYHTLLTELIAKAGSKNKELDISKIYKLILEQDIKAYKLQRTIIIGNNADQKNLEQQDKLYNYIMTSFEISNLSNWEINYLRYFSILPSIEISDIDLKDFFQISSDMENDFYDGIDSLVSKGWLIQSNMKYKIHSLIQIVAKEQLKPTVSNCFTLINGISKKIENNRKENPLLFFPFVEFAESIVKNLHENNILIAKLCNQISSIYWDMKRYINAGIYLKRKLQIYEFIDDFTDPDYAKAFSDVGTFYNKIGEKSKAIDFLEKALSYFEKNPITNYVEFSKTYIVIGMLHFDMRNNELAEKFYFKAISILEQFAPKSHVLADVYSLLVSMYITLKKYDSAHLYSVKALELAKNTYSSNSPRLAYIIFNSANIYYNLEQFDKALKYVDDCLIIWSEILEENNKDLLDAKALKHRILILK